MPTKTTYRSTSMAVRVLRALDAGDDGAGLRAVDILRKSNAMALGAGPAPGTLDGLLKSLQEKKLVNRLVASKRYQITAGGKKLLAQVEGPRFPWRPGMEVAGHRASYKVINEYPHRGRGRMFEAKIKRVKTSDPGWFRTGALVMIKAASAAGDTPMDTARYLQVVKETLDKEILTLERLVGVPHVVDTVDLGEQELTVGGDGKSKGQLVRIPFVIQRRFKGHKHLGAYLRSTEPALTQERWYKWAVGLADGLKNVHTRGTIHRDINPNNVVILDGDRPVFVDVGEAVFLRVPLPERPTMDESLMEQFIAPEQRGGHVEPSHTADIFSLGATLFYMATRRQPNFLITNKDALKEAVTTELQASDSILSHNYPVADLISRCLAVDPSQRIQSARDLLEDLRLCAPSLRSFGTVLSASMEATAGSVAFLQENRHDLFMALAAVELGRVQEKLRSMQDGEVTVEGDRDFIARKLSTYLSALPAGSRYVSETIPRFWRPENLGIRGRYLDENGQLARRGVVVQRLILLTDEDRFDPIVHEIVRALLGMERECCEAGGSRVMETRFKVVKLEEREQQVRQGLHVGLWISSDSLVALRPAYDSRGIIRAVRFKRIDSRSEQQSAIQRLDNSFRSARRLSEWMKER